MSNATLNTVVFLPWTMRRMHEQMIRLYEAAKKIKGVEGQSAVARLLNESPQTVKNWESRGMSKNGLLKAQNLIGANARWLESNEGDMLTRQQEAELIDPTEAGFIPVRRVEFKISAGANGFAIEYLDAGEGEPIFFREQWFRSRGYNPSECYAISVSGRSMEPGMVAGNVVVVNTGITEPQDGLCFAVNYEGQVVVKRLIRDKGEWWLASDNPDKTRFPTKLCDEQVFIIGKVVYKSSEEI